MKYNFKTMTPIAPREKQKKQAPNEMTMSYLFWKRRAEIRTKWKE